MAVLVAASTAADLVFLRVSLLLGEVGVMLTASTYARLKGGSP